MTQRNLFPNPRAHVNASDGWDTSALAGGTWERVTSAPLALPNGADAAYHLGVAGGGYHYVSSDRMPLPAEATQLWEVASYLTDWPGGAAISHQVTFYDAGDAQVGSTVYNPTGPGYSDHWSTQVSDPITIPSGAVTFGVQLGLNSADGDWYLTQLRYDVVDPLGTGEWTEATPDQVCRDGDSEGWVWDAAAHDSASREIETYGANVLINGGACVIFDPAVTLALNPGTVAATEMAVRNDEDGYGAWEAFAATKAWTLSAACKVWAKFRDGA